MRIIGLSAGLAIAGAGIGAQHAAAATPPSPCAQGSKYPNSATLCIDVGSLANGSYVSRVVVNAEKILTDRSRVNGRPAQIYITMRRDSDGWVAHTWSATTTTGTPAVFCSQNYWGDQLSGSFDTPCHKWPDSGYSLWVSGTVDGIPMTRDGGRGIWK